MKSRYTDRKSQSGRARPEDPQQSPTRHAGKSAEERETPENVASVRLTRKYAEMIDGVDLTDANVGDELKLSPHDAEVLVAEGWAEPAEPNHPRRRADDVRWRAADRRPAPHKSKG